MIFEKVQFLNSDGQELSPRLEVPFNQTLHSFGIFVNCFSSNKILTAVRKISPAMNAKGIAVLRFVFTVLGESERDFEEKQRRRLLEIADRCPVRRTLKSEAKIEKILKS